MSNKVFLRVAAVLTGLSAITLWVAPSLAAPESFTVALTGAMEVPSVDTPAKGSAKISYDPSTRVVNWTITYSGLSGPATMAHLHGPAAAGANAPPVIWLTQKGAPAENPIKGEATLTPEQAQQFLAGDWYVNVHTAANPKGEIRGQVTPPKS